MAMRVGQQFGNYCLISLLGEGGFADVYLAEHIYLGTQAAIKVRRTQLASEGIEQFRLEARLIARLEHSHIVHVQDFGVKDGMPFLIMNYAPNGTLRQRHPKGTRVPLPQVISYVNQVASALQYAHEHHIIHRDIKPENLLVGRNNEILLSDFGIALLTQNSLSQSTHELAGTIAYMAPEQIEGHPRFSSDQYSLAVLIYEWLCGSRPFHGSFMEVAAQHGTSPPPPLHERVPTLPLAVEQVVLTALAKEHRQRFATIQAFASDLEQACLSAGLQSSAPTWLSITPPLADPGMALYPVPAPIKLITPQSQPAPLTEIGSLPSIPASSLPAVSPEQSGLAQVPVHPPHRGPSRRTVLLELAALAGAGVIGTGLTWLFHTHTSQKTSATPGSTPSSGPSSSSHTTNTTNSSGAMFGFDPAHTHYNTKEKLLSAANVSQLVLYWTAPTASTILSSPSVANGVVYVGSNDGSLYAFDADTGKKRWSHLTGGEITSSPAVTRTTIYVGSRDSYFYAFDAMTGTLRWRFLTGDLIDSSPCVVYGVVYVGSNDYKLYAFDAATGKPYWATSTHYTINSSPAVYNGSIYVGLPDARLYAFDAVSGTLNWSYPTGSWINSSPTVANGFVYIGSEDGTLYAIHANNGTKYWAVSIGSQINSSPAVANGTVYVGADDGNLYAFNAMTGKQLWTVSVGNQIHSSPVIANGTVYIGSDNGKLYAFNATSGQQLWSILIGHQISSSPTIANGVVYIGSDDGKLYAFHVTGTIS
ncbi:MAG: PQQ-binding-like beta-propeller repeat protein [Chloroflexi bacterium]|nr:PQQ-binding-like beta-propeller repeat protein [Chloroflexota bacterium]